MHQYKILKNKIKELKQVARDHKVDMDDAIQVIQDEIDKLKPKLVNRWHKYYQLNIKFDVPFVDHEENDDDYSDPLGDWKSEIEKFLTSKGLKNVSVWTDDYDSDYDIVTIK